MKTLITITFGICVTIWILLGAWHSGQLQQARIDHENRLGHDVGGIHLVEETKPVLVKQRQADGSMLTMLCFPDGHCEARP